MNLTSEEISRIIEIAWEDRTPFEAIRVQFGLGEPEVIALMRRELSPSAWKRWRGRVQGRKTKHARKRSQSVNRFACSRQRLISHNGIAKR
jgi:uncharacterized protein (TIGR03643 family)